MLSPELVAQFQEAIASGQIILGNPGGRSPLRPRQLHDLNLPPTKDDPRPTFFWSAEKPRNDPFVHLTHEYPRLMWAPDGKEITVLSREAQAEKLKVGYLLVCPLSAVLDPMEELQRQFAMLPDEDRQAIMKATNENRIETMVEQLAKLDQSQLDAIFKITAQARKKAS